MYTEEQITRDIADEIIAEFEEIGLVPDYVEVKLYDIDENTNEVRFGAGIYFSFALWGRIYNPELHIDGIYDIDSGDIHSVEILSYSF